ncbi:MAG TPA: GNAT family N-acetyltransferase [Candidatus Binataceae bacterium]|jgi:ribosomal-protein-alanine N-acetyltransferase|nr:GNAT family N-acetyltransferase [Candidatus Binataceae bacterium]
MINAGPLILRPWRFSDADAIVRHGNNRKIWLNLRDRFPHPYTDADARAWLALRAADIGDPHGFAIEFNAEAIGGIGLEVFSDVHRMTAEIGYWLGESMWGRGFATLAVKAVTEYAFATFQLNRLQAMVFEWNPASARVLEKAEYTLEGRLRNYIFKDNRIGDALMYARLRE